MKEKYINKQTNAYYVIKKFHVLIILKKKIKNGHGRPQAYLFLGAKKKN